MAAGTACRQERNTHLSRNLAAMGSSTELVKVLPLGPWGLQHCGPPRPERHVMQLKPHSVIA